MKLRSVQILGGMMKMMQGVDPTEHLHILKEGRPYVELSVVPTDFGPMVKVQRGESTRLIPLSQCIIEPELGEPILTKAKPARAYVEPKP